MGKVICFGEIMLRLSPPGYERITQARSFDIVFGGAEANVAVSLANFGEPAAFVSKLPGNPVGDACLNDLRRCGVDVSRVARGGDRLGVFYCEKGASMRPSVVIYDRAGSSFAHAAAGDFDWDAIFDGADWLHVTGITPALGGSLPAITKEACRKAKVRGLTVSCDVNYRSKLWSRENAAEVMGGLMESVDVLINPADIFEMPESPDYASGCRKLAGIIAERHGIRRVAFTLRDSLSASDNGWSGLLFDGGSFYESKRYDIHVVDRVGGGDAFTAGLIYGYGTGMGPQDTLEFAVAASALKHTVEGDFNRVSAREVMELMGGDASGKVQR